MVQVSIDRRFTDGDLDPLVRPVRAMADRDPVLLARLQVILSIAVGRRVRRLRLWFAVAGRAVTARAVAARGVVGPRRLAAAGRCVAARRSIVVERRLTHRRSSRAVPGGLVGARCTARGQDEHDPQGHCREICREPSHGQGAYCFAAVRGRSVSRHPWGMASESRTGQWVPAPARCGLGVRAHIRGLPD